MRIEGVQSSAPLKEKFVVPDGGDIIRGIPTNELYIVYETEDKKGSVRLVRIRDGKDCGGLNERTPSHLFRNETRDWIMRKVAR